MDLSGFLMTTDEIPLSAPARRIALTQSQIRNAAFFIASVLAVFVVQPATPIRNLDFWLPFASLAITVIVWAGTSSEWPPRRATLIDAGVITGIVLLVAALRYIDPLSAVLTRSRPPDIFVVLMALVFVAGLALIALRFVGQKPALTTVLVLLLIGLLIVLKWEPLTQGLSAGIRAVQAQSVGSASAFDIRWLGFSYIAFRLIGSLRDRAAGKLPAMTLREFTTYVVFFPSLISGPIDRADRFVKDLRLPFTFNMADTTEGARRIAMGAFKKFVIADTLALIALNEVNAQQVFPGGWTWVLLYAYALRIFFDFAGYTDIALGVARFFGIKLPENFRNPYLKPNLTQFWNSWHMSLTQWIRAYYFNPFTRTLRQKDVSMTTIIFLSQVTTMLIIGLWHGITVNFVIWGLWHGIGLFVHNRWGDFAKRKLAIPPERAGLQKAMNIAGIAITFNYVALGWVWFALPTPALALSVFQKLFGIG
jgi:D-alanyl-lipoteichoic acid acyltransferase DltB (MBOAT superfamily)